MLIYPPSLPPFCRNLKAHPLFRRACSGATVPSSDSQSARGGLHLTSNFSRCSLTIIMKNQPQRHPGTVAQHDGDPAGAGVESGRRGWKRVEGRGSSHLTQLRLPSSLFVLRSRPVRCCISRQGPAWIRSPAYSPHVFWVTYLRRQPLLGYQITVTQSTCGSHS